MKVIRPLVAVAVGMSLVVAGSAGAATKSKLPKAKPVTFMDPAGDANFSNDQGGLFPAAPPSMGSSLRKGADITSVKLGRIDDGKTIKFFTLAMTLDGPPEQSTQYRIAMSSPTCTTYYVEYQFPPTGTTAAVKEGGTLRENCSGSTVFTPVDAVIKGNTITWSIPVKGAPGDVKLDTVMTLKYGQANLETAAIFPAFDMVAMEGTFKVGQ